MGHLLKRKDSMKIGSLFTGAGMLDRAVEQVFDAETIWVAEIDPNASKVLHYNMPWVPNLGDVTKIDWSTVPAVDILTGGFPCQDVSCAGKKEGLKDGTRSGLWSVFAEAIDNLQPKIVVIENVKGLLSAKATRSTHLESCETGVGASSDRPLRAAGAVLGDLSERGYDAKWCTLPASDAGAAHRRERVFILAYASR